MKTTRILACLALAVAAQAAFALPPGFTKFVPHGTVVAGTCPTGQVMVTMAYSTDPDQPKDVNYVRRPDDVVRCVTLADGVQVQTGDVVTLGFDDQKRFRVLSRATQKKR